MPRRPERCVFYDKESGRRCRRNGTGTPPLCQMCRDALDQREQSPFAEIFGSILSGKRPSQRSVEDAIRDVTENVFGKRMSKEQIDELLSRARAAATGAGAGGSSSQSSSDSSGARSSTRKEQERSEAEKAREISRARRILGFTAMEPLTVDTVKKRYRELARKHHPDMGGSTAKMAELNRAMEILTGPG